MVFRIKTFSVYLFCVVLLLPGCVYQSKLIRSGRSLWANHYEEHGLQLSVRTLSNKDCNDYFGDDLIAQGFCPVQIRIVNKSADSFTLRPSYCDLARVPGAEVAQLLHYDTYNRVTWLTLPALLFWWPAVLFIIPYGFSCREYNKKVTAELEKVSLHRDETLVIAPYEVVVKIMFVPAHALRESFDMKFFNETNKQLVTFAVTV